jgi:hypothetical protein
MASSYIEKHYDYTPSTPERGLKRIQTERRRKGLLAAVLFAAAVTATLGFVYLAYNDVPAPSDPANAESGRVRPYH